MAEWHIPEGLFEQFLRQETTREETQRIVRHLLSGCPICSAASYRLSSQLGLIGSLETPAEAEWEDAYDEVFDRALAFANREEQRLAVEKLRGWAQWAALEPLEPQARSSVIESDPRYHTYGLYLRLLEASRWYSHTEPSEAVDIVRLAILVAERLDRSTIGEPRAIDLQAAAWGALGNAMRIANDFEGARQAFKEAWKILDLGTGDPAEEANLISLEASYMKDIGEFEAAEAALEEALRRYKDIDDAAQQGRIWLQMGEIIGHVNPDRGISHIHKSLAVLDMSNEPWLELCAQHALAWFLDDSGSPEEALAVLERARPLYKLFSDELSQLRMHWLEGRIAYRLGHYEEAENIFAQIWEEFRIRDLHQEVVLVTIDLAQVLTAKGETARAARLAADSYRIMATWGLHRDALAAWLVFQDALAQGRQIGKLFDRIGAYYRRHWFKPGEFALEK